MNIYDYFVDFFFNSVISTETEVFDVSSPLRNIFFNKQSFFFFIDFHTLFYANAIKKNIQGPKGFLLLNVCILIR